MYARGAAVRQSQAQLQRSFVVDHNHKTGNVRRTCCVTSPNAMIGCAREDTAIPSQRSRVPLS